MLDAVLAGPISGAAETLRDALARILRHGKPTRAQMMLPHIGEAGATL